MDIIISNASNDPIYLQIVKQIKGMIMSGELKAGDPLPSMRNMALQMRISLITTKHEREQTDCLWNFINDIRPTCIDRRVRKETRGILWQLVKKRIWPTSYLIVLYLVPFIFYIKFIRNLVPKISKINVNHYSCCIS